MRVVTAILTESSEGEDTATLMDAFLDGTMGLSTNIINLHNLSKCIMPVRGGLFCTKSNSNVGYGYNTCKVKEDIASADCIALSLGSDVIRNGMIMDVLGDILMDFVQLDGTVTLKPGKKSTIMISGPEPEQDLKAISDRLTKMLALIGFDVVDTVVYSSNGGRTPSSTNKEVLRMVKDLGSKYSNDF